MKLDRERHEPEEDEPLRAARFETTTDRDSTNCGRSRNYVIVLLFRLSVANAVTSVHYVSVFEKKKNGAERVREEKTWNSMRIEIEQNRFECDIMPG